MSVLSEAPIDRLLTPADVAEVLGVRRPYVYELVNGGKLKSLKINGLRRVRLSELNAWINAHTE